MASKFESVFPAILIACSCLSLAATSGWASGALGAKAGKAADKKSAAKASATGATVTDGKGAKSAEAGTTPKVETKPAAKADTKQAAKKPETAGAVAYSGPPVLEPSQFFGEAAMGYASAKACPEVVSKVFCYCGCDISDGHGSLVDCYTGLHGTDCHICQEEAVLALRMKRNGSSIAEIQKKIDQEYAGKYPFSEESPALKKYKATRLWKAATEHGAAMESTKSDAADASKAADASASGTDAGKTSDTMKSSDTTKTADITKSAEAKSANAIKDTATAATPKLKPGMKAGACCHDHQK